MSRLIILIYLVKRVLKRYWYFVKKISNKILYFGSNDSIDKLDGNVKYFEFGYEDYEKYENDKKHKEEATNYQ